MGAAEWVGVVRAARRAKVKRATIDTMLEGRPAQYGARWLDEQARLALPGTAKYVTVWQLMLRVDIDGAKRLGIVADVPTLAAALSAQVDSLNALWDPQAGLQAPMGGARGQKLTLAMEDWRDGLPDMPWVVPKDRWLSLHLALQNWSGMVCG